MGEGKPNLGGRPRIEINWADVEEDCKCQCTAEEIAAGLGCSVDTLGRRCEEDHGMGFAEYFAIKRKAGFKSLRRRQYTAAIDGDKTMLVWLGKQWLGQRDERHIQSSGTLEISKPLSEMSNAELDAEYASATKGTEDDTTDDK